jgi:benzoyl-CoA reductase subunit B
MSGERLEIVEKVRVHQRQWLAQTRARVEAGDYFAICNGDEAEEIFLAMDVPVLVINYWNSLIAAQQKTAHFNQVLHEHGYPGRHFFGLGFASSLDPANAPWGGLPKPALIVGSGRWESEARTTELWARHYGSDYYPMDFNFSTPFKPVPARWWELVRNEWESLVDPERLDERMRQERGLIDRLEKATGRTFDPVAFEASMDLINQQMDFWREAQILIGKTRPCPVSIRDQMSMYQAMWHRGTPEGVDMLRDYLNEVTERVKRKVAGYREERFRLYFNGQTPAWGNYIAEKYAAVTVACSYTHIPDLYARTVHAHDAMRALAARHLFLFQLNNDRLIDVVTSHQCDAAICVEPAIGHYPSTEQVALEAAGIPYLALPRDGDDEEIRGRVSEFIESRLVHPT